MKSIINDKSLNILLIEDNKGDTRLIQTILAKADNFRFSLDLAENLKKALKLFNEKDFDVVLLDLALPDSRGLKTLYKVKDQISNAPIVILTGNDDEEIALSAVRNGAQDYLVKEQTDSALLIRSIRYAIQRKSSENKIKHLNATLLTLRSVNKLISFEKDHNKLCQKVCDEFIKRGYHIARIILMDETGGFSKLVETSSGESLMELKEFLKKGELPECARKALKTGDLVVIEDVKSECKNCPFRGKIPGKGGIVTPLKHEERTYGLLLVHVLKSFINDINDIEEHRLFRELAGDIAMGLHSIELGKKQKKTEEDKKSIQAQLLQSQKMEAIGKLAGTIAHDFNNLLTAIIGYGHLLYDDMEKEDPRTKMLEEILNAGKRAAGLTSQLLAFSRKTPIKLEALNLNSIIAKIEGMIDRLIGEDIIFSSKLEEELPNIKGDAIQIEQVIINLIVNARDAMPKGGKLKVKNEKVSISDKDITKIPYSRKGDFICLSVTDTGKGIAKEKISKIFDPFYTTKKTGTGLGLSVVNEIIKKQKGWTSVESEPGKGTTFKIYLPACYEKKKTKDKSIINLKDLQGKGETILVLEDEDITRKFINKVLKGNGYNVMQAKSIKEASEIMKKKRGKIHMLFSDVVLSDGSGLQFAEEAINKDKELKVILSSGYISEKAELSRIAEKKFKFLEKPYDIQDLLRKVKGNFS
jgi:signal transduction histidine kinase/DNA-binding response OmpR family regulator